MILRKINFGKEPVYYVQKSYRKEDGRPATKNVERLGTINELKKRFGDEDPIEEAKKYIARLTEEEREARRKVVNIRRRQC